MEKPGVPASSPPLHVPAAATYYNYSFLSVALVVLHEAPEQGLPLGWQMGYLGSWPC